MWLKNLVRKWLDMNWVINELNSDIDELFKHIDKFEDDITGLEL